MKGVIFDIARDIVCSEYSITTWDEVLQSAGVDGAYTTLGNYPTAELTAIVSASATLTGRTPTDMLRWLGRRAFSHLIEVIPATVGQPASWQEVLEGLGPLIHTEVARMYPDAKVPDFRATRLAPRIVQLRYSSERALCHLAEGLVVGAGDWYDVVLDVQHLQCTHDGDPHCLLRVTEVSE